MGFLLISWMQPTLSVYSMWCHEMPSLRYSSWGGQAPVMLGTAGLGYVWASHRCVGVRFLMWGSARGDYWIATSAKGLATEHRQGFVTTGGKNLKTVLVRAGCVAPHYLSANRAVGSGARTCATLTEDVLEEKAGKRGGPGPWALTHLLQLEDVLVEVVLQLLVGIVDAELLEAVPLEVLKAKDVQDPDGQALRRGEGGTEET